MTKFNGKNYKPGVIKLVKKRGRYYFGRNSHDEENRNKYLEENREYLNDALFQISFQRHSKEKGFPIYPESILEEASQLHFDVRKKSRNSLDKNEYIQTIRVLKVANHIQKETINITTEPLSVDYMFSLAKRYLLIRKSDESVQKEVFSGGGEYESIGDIPANKEIEPEMMVSYIPALEFPVVQEETIEYSISLRNKIIYEFLFNNKPIGWIEINLLPKYNWDRRYKRATNIILNKVGLTNSHAGFFQGVSIEDAINILEQKKGFDSLLTILKIIEFEKNQMNEIQEEILLNEFSNKKIDLVDKKDIQEENYNETEFQRELQALPNPALGLNINHEPKRKSAEYTATFNSSPRRDALTSKRALASASYLCEIDKEHEYFKSKISQENYVEAHHLIPIQATDDFDLSIDVEANIVSLCPNCHRKLHHAEFSEVKPLLEKLYLKRKKDLATCDIGLTFEHLISYYQ